MENSLILNGFWRSGTTITQDIFSEALHAKAYFEPFEPGLPGHLRYILEFARIHKFDHSNHRLLAVLMPFCEAGGADDDGLWEYLDSIILGSMSNPGLVRNRKSLGEGFRTEKCVKFVRAHFLMRHLWDRYQLPIIHIRRHPYSVIGSLNRVATWNQSGFVDLDLHTVLEKPLKSGTGRAAHLIQRLNQLPPELTKTQKLAAYWCITELMAEEAILDLSGHAVMLQFESFMRGGKEGVLDVLSRLNLKPKGNLSAGVFKRMSNTSHNAAKLAKNYSPNTAYKKILSADDLEEIQGICEHFGVNLDVVEADASSNLYCSALLSR